MTDASSGDGAAPTGYNAVMRTFSTKDAPSRFGELLQAAKRAPVTVVDHGRPTAVMLSIEDYARLRGAAWDRLVETMNRARSGAGTRGLTDDQLELLLADES